MNKDDVKKYIYIIGCINVMFPIISLTIIDWIVINDVSLNKHSFNIFFLLIMRIQLMQIFMRISYVILFTVMQ